MKENFIFAADYSADGKENIFRRVSGLFAREPDSPHGLGEYYIVDIVGTGGGQLVSDVCENHDIPVIDLRARRKTRNLRETVDSILENSPARCAFILETREDSFMQQIRSRIMHKYCDLRYKRVVFCLVAPDESYQSSPRCLHVPGSIADRMTLLLYHIPGEILRQAPSPEYFRPLAEAMVDYSLFWPRIWRQIRLDATHSECLSTALYQVVRRVRADDPGIEGEYPSSEMEWRSLLARRLQETLPSTPDALCPTIHRVIPIGVSASDAIQAMTVAIPKDLQDPYAITLRSSAVENRCGTIAITQPQCYTVIHVHCLVDPGLLADVCRDLRTAHQDVVSGLHSLRRDNAQLRGELSSVQHTLSDVHGTLSEMREQHLLLVSLVARATGTPGDQAEGNTVHNVCSRKKCPRIVTKRFRSGKAPQQCSNCLEHAHTQRKKSYLRPEPLP